MLQLEKSFFVKGAHDFCDKCRKMFAFFHGVYNSNNAYLGKV